MQINDGNTDDEIANGDGLCTVLHFYAISFDIWIIIDINQPISHTPNHAYISKVGPFFNLQLLVCYDKSSSTDIKRLLHNIVPIE